MEKKSFDIRCRVDEKTKERWILLCELNCWNGSDKLRRYIEMLIADNFEEIEHERLRREKK